MISLHRIIGSDKTSSSGSEGVGQFLFDYARAHRYTLARAWGRTAADTQTYFVRPDAPDAAALVSAIRDASYACLAVTTAEVGLFGSVRRALNAIRRSPEPAPACVDWAQASTRPADPPEVPR